MFQRIVLDDGLRVLLVPRSDVKSITTMVFVGAGSRYEDKPVNGIAHFLEHMMFKGTERRPTSLEISEEVDAVGGEFNAGTSKEYTVYYIQAASEHLDMSLDILSDMLLNSKFDAAELESEKGVILEELKMYEDMPMRDIGEVFETTLYGDTPLGWKTIGTREAVSAMTREKMVEFKDNFYTKDNIIVGVAGNFDPAEVTEKVKQYFAALPAKKTGEYQINTRVQTAPEFTFIPKPTEQAHMILGTRGLIRGGEDEYAAKVMNVILGANMSSRLFIEVREKQKLCYYVRSSVSTYADTGSLEVQAGVDLTRVPQAISSILGELKKFSADPVSEKELRQAKQYLRGKMVLAMEDTSNVVEWYGMQELLRDRIRDVEEVMTLIDQVQREDIQAVAKRLFRDENLNLAIISAEKAIQREQLTELLTFGA